MRRREIDQAREVVAELHRQLTHSQDLDMQQAEVLFNPLAPQTTCPACGEAFAPNRPDCPECGLHFC